MAADDKITIVYFGNIARGQMITSVLDIVGKEYELKVIKDEDIKKEKPLSLYGQFPYIEVNGKKLGGTLACARFVAEKYGKDIIDQETDPYITAYREGQADLANGFIDKLFEYHFASEAKKPEMEKIFVDYAKDKFPFLDKAIGQGGVFQGKDGKITWPEIVLCSVLREIKKFYPKHEDLFKDVPNLTAFCENACKLLPKK